MANIHVGSMIKHFVDKHLLVRKEVSKKLGFYNTAIYGYEKRKSIYTDTLLNFCHALQHNFFMDIAQQLPNSYTQNHQSQKDLEIEQLKKEIEKLKHQNDLMKELFGK
jgi:hypothetical protein